MESELAFTYSEDLSVPTHTSEFGFVRHNFVTNYGIEHVKKIISLFFNRKRQASLSIRFEIGISLQDPHQ